MSRSGRALLLALLACGGLAVGFVGQHLTGDSAWFLAVPALIAAGWVFVADPTRCERDPPS